MTPFLAAITARLFSRILGAADPPFGPVMGKRGAADGAGATAGEETETDAAGGSKAAAASADTPKRSATAASPVKVGIFHDFAGSAVICASREVSHGRGGKKEQGDDFRRVL